MECDEINIFVFKLVEMTAEHMCIHYFSDGKEFDAFVSYKSCPRDEEFVLHQLYPKLERDFQFKLCMHFRDFLPGEGMYREFVLLIVYM